MSTNVTWHQHTVTSGERQKLNGHKGAVLWFTGLSGCGKSTIANVVDRKLYNLGVHTYVLDGDNIRMGLNKNLGFSPEDRTENIRRIGEVSKLFCDSGTLVLAAFISPYETDRNQVREMLQEGQFLEIYVKASLRTCEARDPKGLYKKARAGEIKGFTGIDAPYEAPRTPEIVLEADSLSVEELANKVLAYLEAITPLSAISKLHGFPGSVVSYKRIILIDRLIQQSAECIHIMERLNKNRSKAWISICAIYGVRCVADRSWRFFLPLYLSRSCGVRPTAAISLAQNFAVASLSAAAANAYRKGDDCFVTFTVMENVAVAAGGICLSLFAMSSEHNNSLCQAPLHSPLFVIAVVCGCVDAVFSSLLSTVISKEWVATLFQTKKGNQELSLASANSRLAQIDLAAAAICPLIVSYTIQQGGYKMVLVLLVSQHVFGAFLILCTAKRAFRVRPDLGLTRSPGETDTKRNGVMLNPLNIFVDEVVPLKAKLVTIAYVLLYFSVLSPGSVLDAWLNSLKKKHQPIDVTEQTIAWFGSSSNLLGALVTLVTPSLILSMGKYKAGVVAQYFQWTCIMVATISFHRISKDTQLLVNGFLLPVAISRLGLWGFDLVERQILQETVPTDRHTFFFNAERSLTQFASLGMMYLCYIYADPESFGLLVNLSALAVTFASIILGLSMLS